MLANFGTELFPDECTVLEIVPFQHYVFPIFKNGSSSLMQCGFRSLEMQELEKLEIVDVFVRDPVPRFCSGVQTFLSRIDQSLDKKTLLWMIDRYLFLNRHFCPQLYWLINFRRFSKAKFYIRPIEDLSSITTTVANTVVPDIDIVKYFNESSGKFRFFIEMDEIFTVNHINQVVEYEQLMQTLFSNYDLLYMDTFQRLWQLHAVVPEIRSFR